MTSYCFLCSQPFFQIQKLYWCSSFFGFRDYLSLSTRLTFTKLTSPFYPEFPSYLFSLFLQWIANPQVSFVSSSVLRKQWSCLNHVLCSWNLALSAYERCTGKFCWSKSIDLIINIENLLSSFQSEKIFPQFFNSFSQGWSPFQTFRPASVTEGHTWLALGRSPYCPQAGLHQMQLFCGQWTQTLGNPCSPHFLCPDRERETERERERLGCWDCPTAFQRPLL